MAETKPLPTPTPLTEPYWQGLRRHEVWMQRCAACGRYIFYPRSNCPFCLSDRRDWRQITAEGTLYTFTIARRPTAPAFADETPQKIAVVELDEGPRLTTTLVNVAPEAIRIGMRVRPYFDDLADAPITLLRFQPA